jgi:hypothetical protein
MLPVDHSTPADPVALYGALSDALWTQRELLESLLHRLVTQQLILNAGALRWLPKSDDDVRHAISQVRAGEVLRATHVAALITALGLDPDATLTELATFAPVVWHDVMHDHRKALRELAFEVQKTSEENHRLLQHGAQAIRDTLAGVGDAVRRYDANGATVHGEPGALLLDRQA